MLANIDTEALVPRLILTCFIVYALVCYFIASAKAFDGDEDIRPELVNEGDMLAILRPDNDARCRNMKTFSTALSNSSELKDPVDEDSHVCLDYFPRKSTPVTCKVYSIDASEENCYAEMQLAKMGCRVHIVTAQSDLNFGRLAPNLFYYPLHIVAQEENMHRGRDADARPWKPEVGYYTIEDFIALLNHEGRQLSLVKTYQAGSELRLMTSLMTSPSHVWCQMPQLSMVIHLPAELNPETQATFTYTYLLLRRLRSMGYRLALSRPMIPLRTRNSSATNAEDQKLRKSSLLAANGEDEKLRNSSLLFANEEDGKLDKNQKAASVHERKRFFVKELFRKGDAVMEEEEKRDVKPRLAERYETIWLRIVNEGC